MQAELKFPRDGSERKIGVVFGKIANNIAAIREALDGVDQVEFASNRIIRNSVFMDMATIGELLKTVSGNPDNEDVGDPDPYNLMKAFPEIPWKDIKGFRDIVDHSYFSVDANIFWMTVERKLSSLENAIFEMAEAYPGIANEMEQIKNDIKIFEENVIENAKEMGCRNSPSIF